MKKIYSQLIMCVCICLMMAGCTKDAEVLTGTISGFVSDYTNANTAIAGATVTLNSKGLTKTTGSDGRFEFLKLEPGTYSISVTANGFQATTKQVTVYAGQTATCDFQLEVGNVDVDIDPITITFGKSVEQASFSINNKSNQSLNYTISSYPDYIEVSPASGAVAAKGKQSVSVTVVNRKSINEPKNGQITVNVGNNSYIVSFSIEPYQEEKASVDVNPQTLNFDKDTNQLTFTMTSNNSYDQDYKITSNLDILTVEPSDGTLSAKGQTTINVTVNDRETITNARNGQLTIEMNGNTYVVSVNVAKYEEGGGSEDNPDDTPSGDISTTRGLLAYYIFDQENADNASHDNDHGYIIENASFITDTPNGKGKAISLERGNYVNIPSNLLDGKKSFTISMWLKDFGAGFLFRTEYQHGYNVDRISISSPSIYINDENKLHIAYSNYGGVTSKFSIQKYQSSGWHMLTIVWDGDNDLIFVYLDGKKVDSIGSSWIKSDGESMQIGGTDPMITDNVRIHSVILSDKEIAEIYAAESK